MSTPPTRKLCAWCGKPTVDGERFSLVNAPRNAGGRLRLTTHWCVDCAPKDEVHLALADTFNLPSGPQTDDLMRAAWLRMHNAIIARHGVEGMRGCIEIYGDIAGAGVTLRGRGGFWGVPSLTFLKARRRRRRR